MRLAWSKAALRDLEELAAYISEESAQGAEIVESGFMRQQGSCSGCLVQAAVAGFPEPARS